MKKKTEALEAGKTLCCNPKDTFLANLGSNIKKVRKDLKMSQEQMCERINITQAQLSNLENGLWNIPVADLVCMIDNLYSGGEVNPYPLDSTNINRLLEVYPSYRDKIVWIATPESDYHEYKRYKIIGDEGRDTSNKTLFAAAITREDRVRFDNGVDCHETFTSVNYDDIIAITSSSLTPCSSMPGDLILCAEKK